MSDIERLKAFYEIEGYLDDETKDLLIQKLNLEDANLEKRLPGIKAEDEFVLILYFSNSLKHIVSLDETTSVLTEKSYQSDFILHFKDDSKMMVEVKSKQDNKFKISKNNLENRRIFASDLGYKLYFAIRLHGYWMLFHSDYLVANNFCIDLEKDMDNSIFYTKFDSSMYIIPEGIIIESLYYKHTEKGLGIKHEKFGKLISYKLYYQNQLLVEVSREKIEYLFFSLIFELWHDLLSQDMIVKEIDDNITLLTEETKEELLTLDFKYFLSSISHITNDYNKGRYNASSFLKLLASGENVALTKEPLEITLRSLKNLGVPIVFSKFLSSNEIKYE